MIWTVRGVPRFRNSAVIWTVRGVPRFRNSALIWTMVGIYVHALLSYYPGDQPRVAHRDHIPGTISGKMVRARSARREHSPRRKPGGSHFQRIQPASAAERIRLMGRARLQPCRKRVSVYSRSSVRRIACHRTHICIRDVICNPLRFVITCHRTQVCIAMLFARHFRFVIPNERD